MSVEAIVIISIVLLIVAMMIIIKPWNNKLDLTVNHNSKHIDEYAFTPPEIKQELIKPVEEKVVDTPVKKKRVYKKKVSKD